MRILGGRVVSLFSSTPVKLVSVTFSRELDSMLALTTLTNSDRAHLFNNTLTIRSEIVFESSPPKSPRSMVSTGNQKCTSKMCIAKQGILPPPLLPKNATQLRLWSQHGHHPSDGFLKKSCSETDNGERKPHRWRCRVLTG